VQALSVSGCASGAALPREANRSRKMTTMSSASSAASAAIQGTPGGLTRQFGAWAHALVAYWHRRAAIKALRQLDDRALRDIGLARCHIEAAVGGGALNPEMGRLR
jgi:uncharacterized protein YjiS (DUF1127 family)